jgi:hypothetical protein
VSLSSPTTLPAELVELVERTQVCEHASLTRDGRPVTWPLAPYVGAGGSLDVTTGLTYPNKAERARRDPRVALLFSSPVGTGLTEPPVVLVQGLASVRDADLQATTDRYVRDVRRKAPEAYRRIPDRVLRGMDWYFARIYIEMTPLRALIWPGGRLDVEPERWTAPEGTTAPPSDPAPAGRALPLREKPPQDWRPFADRADGLGAPVLTVTDTDGWPLALRCRDAVRTLDGYLLQPPAGVAVGTGPACFTAHAHPAAMDQQVNVVLLGSVEPADDGWVHLRVERALPDWSITGSKVGAMVGFLRKGRKLRPRLRLEAERRGQQVPEVRL